MRETFEVTFIAAGLFFNLCGCIGLVRLPDIYNGLQAAVKSVTLGTCLMLFGVAVHFGLTETGVKALLCAAFLLLTSPVAAHALARGAYVSGMRLTGSQTTRHPTEDKPADSPAPMAEKQEGDAR